MLKTLYYTLSTPDEAALACTKLMHKSLVQKLGNIDFKIVIPQRRAHLYPLDIRPLLLSSAKVNPRWPGVLDLKYTKTVFDLDYDHFVFLDSDILWFANDFNPCLNQYCEDVAPINTSWFSTGWPSVPTDERRGVNAGFFSVDKQTGVALSKYMHANIGLKAEYFPPLEQSMYNLFLHESNYEGWHRISDKFVLFANERDKVEDGKIYHFMNYTGHMRNKIKQMECFIATNAAEEIVKTCFCLE